MQVRCDGVTLGYAGGTDVVRDVSCVLAEGWTGVVGANGAGKSTWLRALVCAVGGSAWPRGLTLRAGSFQAVPKGMSVVRLSQRTLALGDGALPPAVEAFAWCFDGDALRWRARLGLGDDEAMRWATLSPGERRRWQVAAALHTRPHLLVLDEPFNHLDAAASDVLVDALSSFDGVGVIVSHNRAVLEALTTSTVRFHGGGAQQYAGAVTKAEAQWQLEAETLRGAALVELESARRAAEAADRRARAAGAAERRRSAGARMKNPGDRDAAGIAAQVRTNRAAATVARSAGRSRREAAAAAASAGAAAAAVSRLQSAVGLDFAYTSSPRSKLATLPPPLHANCPPIIHREANGGWRLEHDSRWWISGPNGAGKTTWLRAALASLKAANLVVNTLAQETDIPTIRTRLLATPSDSRGQILRAAGALGVDVPVLLRTEEWSPGQARKVGLATLACRPAHVLVLDEPTHHLDLPSRDALATALSTYPGALILVSHDAAFASTVRAVCVPMKAR